MTMRNGLHSLPRSELLARQAAAIARRDFTHSATLARVLEAMQSSSVPSFGFLSTAELSEALPPVNYVVEALDICPGRPTQITGAGFSGKTLIAQSMLTSIILGRPVWDRFVSRQGPCVHLDYEMGRRLTVERYRRLSTSQGVSWEEQVAPFLRLAPLPSVHMNDATFAPLLEEAATGAAVVLIDSLRRALPGEDENASAISRYIDTLTRVSESSGATILFLHHSTTKPPPAGLDGDRRGAGRGSSAIYDASGAVFSLSGQLRKPVRVEQTKAAERGIPAGKFWLKFEDVEVDGDPRAGLRVVVANDPEETHGDDAESRVMEAVRRAGAQGIRGGDAVRKAAGIRGKDAYAAVTALLISQRIANVAFCPDGKPDDRHPRYVAAQFVTRPALKGAEREESSADEREEREES